MKEKIKCFGIEMSHSSFYVINQRLEQITESCPAQSYIHLEFQSLGSYVYGTLSLNSNQFNFIASRSGLSPIETYFYLETELLKRINRWRKERFSTPDDHTYSKQKIEVS